MCVSYLSDSLLNGWPVRELFVGKAVCLGHVRARIQLGLVLLFISLHICWPSLFVSTPPCDMSDTTAMVGFYLKRRALSVSQRSRSVSPHRHTSGTARRFDGVFFRSLPDLVCLGQASSAINELRDAVDTLIVVANDRLLEVAGAGIPLERAFSVADDILRQVKPRAKSRRYKT